MSYMESKYPPIIVVEAMKNLLNMKQLEDKEIVDYTRRFKSARDVLVSHLGGDLMIPKLAKLEPSNSNHDYNNINSKRANIHSTRGPNGQLAKR